MLDRLFYWRKANHITLCFIAISVLMFGVARLAFIGQHGGEQSLSLFVWDTLWWGLRVDLKMAALMCLPFYLVLVSVVACNSRWSACSFSAYRNVLYLLLLLSLFFAVVNHFYYFNFQNHIDIFIFEFLSWENTKAVSFTVWQDYPVIPALVLLVLVAWLLFKALILCSRKSSEAGQLLTPKWIKLHVILMILVLMILGRGSLGVFPLMLTHISIAGDLLLTRAVANGPFALAEAWVEWKEMRQLSPVSEDDFRQAYLVWFDGKEPETLVEENIEPILDVMPNVLVFQMESMGGHLASLHSDRNPILGRLAKHRGEDMWFNNFISSTKGTLGSVEKLLANTGVSNISQSSYRKHTFSATPASIFKKMGYHTIFLTGGTKTWSNLNEFLSSQGFDEVLDVQDIKNALPHAQDDGVWGVYDGFTFEYVLKLLQEKHEQPLFIYTMSITNHSPYILPEEAKVDHFFVPKSFQSKVFKGDMNKAELVLQSYHYSSDQLGGMMDTIKESALRKNTIVATTGDHYMRDIFNYYQDEADILYQYQVPFYLYLPSALRTSVNYDAQRFGSHKDIFPTIFSRLLTHNPLHTGQDLLAESTGISMSEEFAMNKQGAVLKLGQQALYYKWQDDSHLVLQQTISPSPSLKILLKKYQAYKILLRWQSMQDIQTQDEVEQ